MQLLVPGDLFSLSHYEYGEAYYGSLAGMRFRVAREPLVDVRYVPAQQRADAVLRAVVWPEPDSFGSAPSEAKTEKDFPFSQDGLNQAIQWLCEIHHIKFEQTGL